MNDLQFSLSRRSFLGAAAAFGVASLTGIRTGQAAEADVYGGFKVGIQSYSLRGFEAVDALKHTVTLGLKFWEAYPRHIPLGTVPDHIAAQKKLLSDAGITLMSYGVLGFDENETKAREAFDFAKAMGIVSLSANPKKSAGTFDLLDKLCEEYGVAIAIHNHGPGALYDKISDVEEWVKDRHPLVGACVDTGHYIRSDEDPAQAISRLGQRVFGVHLKDFKTVETDGKRGKQPKILGEGDLNVVACLTELRKLKYDKCVAIEYEENPSNPLSDIEVCLQVVRDAVKSMKA